MHAGGADAAAEDGAEPPSVGSETTPVANRETKSIPIPPGRLRWHAHWGKTPCEGAGDVV